MCRRHCSKCLGLVCLCCQGEKWCRSAGWGCQGGCSYGLSFLTRAVSGWRAWGLRGVDLVVISRCTARRGWRGSRRTRASLSAAKDRRQSDAERFLERYTVLARHPRATVCCRRERPLDCHRGLWSSADASSASVARCSWAVVRRRGRGVVLAAQANHGRVPPGFHCHSLLPASRRQSHRLCV